MQRLRRQLILVHRQFMDDAPLLFGALALTTIMLSVFGFLAFIHPHDFLLHIVSVFVVLPFPVGAGLFLLGTIQSRSEGEDDVAGVLSAKSDELIFARVITGAVFVTIVVGALAMAISRAAITGLLQWPESLLPQGLIDLSGALLLIGLACYFAGFLTRLYAKSLIASLCFLPLSLPLVSLFTIKGLGGPLAAVLVPFIVALFICVLALATHSRFAAAAFGFTSLELMAVLLLGARYSLDVARARVTLAASDEVEVTCHQQFHKRSEHYWDAESFKVHGSTGFQPFPAHHGQVHFLFRPLGLISYLQASAPLLVN